MKKLLLLIIICINYDIYARNIYFVPKEVVEPLGIVERLPLRMNYIDFINLLNTYHIEYKVIPRISDKISILYSYYSNFEKAALKGGLSMPLSREDFYNKVVLTNITYHEFMTTLEDKYKQGLSPIEPGQRSFGEIPQTEIEYIKNQFNVNLAPDPLSIEKVVIVGSVFFDFIGKEGSLELVKAGREQVTTYEEHMSILKKIQGWKFREYDSTAVIFEKEKKTKIERGIWISEKISYVVHRRFGGITDPNIFINRKKVTMWSYKKDQRYNFLYL